MTEVHRHHTATFYVQLDPHFTYDTRGATSINRVTAVAMTPHRPTSQQRPGTALLKVTVLIPDQCFAPLKAYIELPEPEDVTVHVTEAELS